jgi:hypothetical protein
MVIFIKCFLRCIFYLFCVSQVVAQCDSDTVVVFSQSELNDFFSENPDCHRIKDIIIQTRQGQIDPVVSLSGFSQLDSINQLVLLDSPGITSLEGLQNISFIETLTIRLPLISDLSQLASIEKIGELRFQYNEFIRDLTFLKGVNLTKSLYLNGDGKISDLELPNSKFLLEVRENNHPNNFAFLESQEVDSLSIFLSKCSNFSFEGLRSKSKMYELAVTGIPDLDFSALENLTQITGLYLVSSKYKTSIKDLELPNLQVIECILDIVFMDSVKTIRQVLPRLSKIGYGVYIINNRDLYSISSIGSLDVSTGNFETLLDENFITALKRINIVNNRSLEYCTNEYVCEMIHQYDDQFIKIENNGYEGCFLSELNIRCDSLISSDKEAVLEESKIKTYPNPAISEVRVESLKPDIKSIQVYDLMGKLVQVLNYEIPSRMIIVRVDEYSVGLYSFIIQKETGERLTKLINVVR